ncbi:MAG: 16S rRNA (uracil(1498)-N(3))-methyltransferase [Planctomycetes bacterium]|nr:16S rRNA (uracil(1498)-N(3))-methyltransferase [Planctomycetota bacterium]
MSLRTLLLPGPLKSGTVIVEGDEAHHGRVVLRLRPGEDIRVADGAGWCASAVVTGVGREALEIEVSAIEAVPEGPAALLGVVCAVPKGDRFADLVRGLSELGVGSFQPLVCERGERPPANLDRQRRIATEAIKQSRRSRTMEIHQPIDVQTVARSTGPRIICDPAGVPAVPGPPVATTLVIGPEGGFTDEEREALVAGGRSVRLASTILRIETAALAASAVWVAAWEASRP